MRGSGEGGVDPAKPAAAETPEVRKCAVALPPDCGVSGECHAWLGRARRAERDRADLSVGLDAERFLEKTRGRADAVIDAGIEVHERERWPQCRAARRLPVAALVDVADKVVGDRAEGRFQIGESLARHVDAALAGVDGKRDALVGRAAWIVRIVRPAAFHRKNVAEREIEFVAPRVRSR